MAKVKRVGGSTFLLVPPDIARQLELAPGQEVAAEVRPRYPSLNEVLDAVWGLDPEAQYLDRDEAWGDFGERSWE